MINILTVALESRINLLFTEMKSISPADVSIFHEKDIRIITVIFGFEETVVKAGVSHENDVIEIEGVSDGMLI
jgi:hypothetical protein